MQRLNGDGEGGMLTWLKDSSLLILTPREEHQTGIEDFWCRERMFKIIILLSSSRSSQIFQCWMSLQRYYRQYPGSKQLYDTATGAMLPWLSIHRQPKDASPRRFRSHAFIISNAIHVLRELITKSNSIHLLPKARLSTSEGLESTFESHATTFPSPPSASP